MSNNVITLLEAALENSDLQKQLHQASTPDRFVNIAEANGYLLNSNELAQTLGKFHAIFGSVVESMLDSMPPDADSNHYAETVQGEKVSGANLDLVKRLFSRGEAFDSAGFVTFFTDNPVYQFGNFDVCFDKQSIKQSADNFFSQIDAVYHEIKQIWEAGDLVFVEIDVTYWRKDGSMISLPCCDIFRVAGDKFSELRIFMDVNPVFDASIPVPASASVLTATAGTRLIPPGTMKQHFAQHPEGQQRVKDGFAPKWSITGPKWAISNADSPQSPEQLDAVSSLAQAVIAQDWNTVKSYLTDDVYYKVGSGAPLYGKQAVVDFFIQTFQTTAVFTGHMVRKIWQEPEIITLEMDAYYQMVASGKTVTIACCDIYRLRGNQVSEWRVYADMSPWNESTI